MYSLLATLIGAAMVSNSESETQRVIGAAFLSVGISRAIGKLDGKGAL